MISPIFVCLWLGSLLSPVSAGPIPEPNFHVLRPRQLNGTEPSFSRSSDASNPSETGMSGKVPAIGNNPENSLRISFPTTSQRAQQTAVVSSTTPSGASVTIQINIAPSSAVASGSSNATASKEVNFIGIVQINPGRTPPLTFIAPIDPAKLSIISAELASINGIAVQTNQIAAGDTTATTTASGLRALASHAFSSFTNSSGQVIGVASSTSSRIFVSATTFPLLNSPNPIRSSSSLIVSPVVSAPPISIAGSDADQDITITTTITRISTTTLNLSPSPQRGSDGDASGEGQHQHSHHHHSRPVPTVSSTQVTAFRPSSSAQALDMPNNSARPESTITIQASQPSGVAIIPFDPNAPAAGVQAANLIDDAEKIVTVTVTERVAETTKLLIKTVTLV